MFDPVNRQASPARRPAATSSRRADRTRLYRTLLLGLCLMAPAFLPAPAQDNPLDRFLEQRLEKTKLPFPVIDDMTFIRRSWLDITGDLPYQHYLDGWLAQGGPIDRARVVEDALATRLYQSRWATYFAAMFDIHGLTPTTTSYRYGFRSGIRRFLADDAGWDEIVRDIIRYQGGLRDDISYYLLWHQASGVDNTLIQDVFDDQAAFLSEKLLGIQTRCISCHDGTGHLEKVNVDLTGRKRKEFWELAAFLSSGTLFCPEGKYCDINGVTQYHKFTYVHVDDPDFSQGPGVYMPEGLFIHDGAYLADSQSGQGMRPPRRGGEIQPRYPFTGEEPLPGETRREALARILTADRQFARNMVNRLWHHFIGTPFVWPYNDFDLARIDAETAAENDTTVQPNDPEMLEFLTDLFIAGDYRLKPFIRTIIDSRIYQLDYAVLAPGNEGAYWGGPLRMRRLEAESIVNSIEWAAGVKPAYLSSSTQYVQRNPWDMLQDEPRYDFQTRNVPQAIQSYGIETVEQLYDHQKALGDFLLGMGRGNREENLPPKTNLDQEVLLFLINATWVLNDILDRSPVVDDLHAQWQSGQIDADEVVERIFLRSLFRKPTPAELARTRAQLVEGGTRAAVADIMWATFNAVDFLYR